MKNYARLLLIAACLVTTAACDSADMDPCPREGDCDLDQVPDDIDNCDRFNPKQVDADQDGIGDDCAFPIFRQQFFFREQNQASITTKVPEPENPEFGIRNTAPGASFPGFPGTIEFSISTVHPTQNTHCRAEGPVTRTLQEETPTRRHTYYGPCEQFGEQGLCYQSYHILGSETFLARVQSETGDYRCQVGDLFTYEPVYFGSRIDRGFLADPS